MTETEFNLVNAFKLAAVPEVFDRYMDTPGMPTWTHEEWNRRTLEAAKRWQTDQSRSKSARRTRV